MNSVRLGQNTEFQAQKLQTINIKPGNLFIYKAQKIKTKYECKAHNKNFLIMKIMLIEKILFSPAMQDNRKMCEYHITFIYKVCRKNSRRLLLS